MQSTVSYVSCGDGYVAYQVTGRGPHDLLVIYADLTHLEHRWREPSVARFQGRLGDWSRLICFDKRGFGLSDPMQGSPTLEARMVEIDSVLDAVGSERTALLGVWEGGHMAMMYAAQHPERVSSLVLYGSGARHTSAPGYEYQLDRASREAAILYLTEHWGDPNDELIVSLLAPSRTNDRAFREWLAELTRLACSPGRYVETARWALDTDVREILPAISVPTLVIHRTGDQFCPVENGRYLAEHIPGAQLVELPGEDHLPFTGDSDAITDAVEAFVTGRIARRRRASHVVPAALGERGVTRREFEVLDLVASGATNADIAEVLHISVRTVESHVSSLLTKLGSDNRAGLIAAGIATRGQHA